MNSETTTNTTGTAVSLQPGRELDALIVERVLGWVGSSSNHVPFLDDGRFDGYFKPGVEFLEFVLDEDVPHYSTDITAAMEVWETLPKPRRLHETEVGVVVMCGGRSFGPDTDFIHDAIAMGETAAHAICLAALKVVEE